MKHTKYDVAIITLYGNNNYGNKLQNYAVQEILKKHNKNPITIRNRHITNESSFYFLRYFKYIMQYIMHKYILRDGMYTNDYGNNNDARTSNFMEFDSYINTTKDYFNYFNIRKYSDYDYYVVGSDQVWNPQFGLRSLGFVDFIKDKNKKIAISASFGVSDIQVKNVPILQKGLEGFKAISVRENAGKDIILKISQRNDIEVLVDPTMLLTTDDWNIVAKKPKKLDQILKNGEKFILNYFLGSVSEDRKREIHRIANENKCKIINILDKDDPFYECGPSEFIWLESHAFMICTDSFHSSVFAILYKVPFIVFGREDSLENMNSRIETLLEKFNLQSRYFDGKKISDELLKCDYKGVDKIIEAERKKAHMFIARGLDE